MAARRLRLAARRFVGPGEPTLVVAEIGQNHNGNAERAAQLVDVAAWAGADAVKFVKRDLDLELTRAFGARRYESPHAYGRTYAEHRRALELSPADYERLTARARQHGLLVVATACDAPSAEQMFALGIDVFKVASRDLDNLPLVERLARLGQPLFLSTGMSDLAQIDSAAAVVERHTRDFALLHCTSLYPTPFSAAHLASLATLRDRFGVLVGFSDHTPGTLLGPVAVGLGAAIVEKHLTLCRTDKGSDHACSLEPEQFRSFVQDIRHVETALGSPSKPVPRGVSSVRDRLGRSLVTRGPLPAGTPLDESMFVLKSPGDGISWLQRDQIVGRRLKRPLAADAQLHWDDLAP